MSDCASQIFSITFIQSLIVSFAPRSPRLIDSITIAAGRIKAKFEMSQTCTNNEYKCEDRTEEHNGGRPMRVEHKEGTMKDEARRQRSGRQGRGLCEGERERDMTRQSETL